MLKYHAIAMPAIAGPPLAGLAVDQTHWLSLPMVISTGVMGASTILAGVTGAVDLGQKMGYLNML